MRTEHNQSPNQLVISHINQIAPPLVVNEEDEYGVEEEECLPSVEDIVDDDDESLHQVELDSIGIPLSPNQFEIFIQEFPNCFTLQTIDRQFQIEYFLLVMERLREIINNY